MRPSNVLKSTALTETYASADKLIELIKIKSMVSSTYKILEFDPQSFNCKGENCFGHYSVPTPLL